MSWELCIALLLAALVAFAIVRRAMRVSALTGLGDYPSENGDGEAS